MATRRRPADRPPLTTERLVETAVALADRDGIDALSMRRLAQQLGFEVMALYNHIESKHALLDALVEHVAGELVPAPDAVEWRQAVGDAIGSARRSFRRHPWVVPLWSSQRTGPARLAFQEALLRAMRTGGLTSVACYHGYHALLMHVLGFSLQEARIPFEPAELPAAAERFRAALPADTYPYLTEHMELHIAAHDGLDHDFELILELILDGLARL